MTDKSATFEYYLTEHLNNTGNSTSRIKKKQWLKYNYKNLLLSISKESRILEVGPGGGELLELLVNDMNFRNVTAIDISKEVVEFCNEIVPGTTTLVNEDCDYLNNKIEQFECIMMLHVLEHLTKDRIHEFLTLLYSSLRKGGLIVIEVPNMANPLVGLNYRYADFTHEVGFTESSLRYVLSRAGFTDIQIFPSQLPTYSISRKLQFILQSILNAILSWLIRIYLPTDSPITSTAIYAIAYKSN